MRVREGPSTIRAGRGREGIGKGKRCGTTGRGSPAGREKEGGKGRTDNQPAAIEQTGRKRHFNERPLAR